MSRYVCDFLVNLSPQHVRSPLRKILAACGLEPIYDLEDYLMAREIPGRVSFTRLVTAEVLIDTTNATDAAVKLSFVLKNEELPLNANNHCRQVFDLLRLTIAHEDEWQPLNSLQSNSPFTKAIASSAAESVTSPIAAARSAILN
ncbi:hypothetical protein [Chamaesiphon sp.]|uniref:hypothetical protein n=1 Tax=Chamaesiphon sp. TaxID=2814140 RepID=UPI003593352A